MHQPPLSDSTETTNIIPLPTTVRPPGRPTICSQQIIDEICAIIRLDGLSDSMAALLAGVSTSTISRWKQDDENVAVALGQARAQYERERLRAIRGACKRDGSADWRAQAWLLQKSSPEQYGPPSRRRQATKPAPAPDTEMANGRNVITPYELTLLQKKRAHVLEQRKVKEEAEKARQAEKENAPKFPETRGEHGESAGSEALDEGKAPDEPSPAEADRRERVPRPAKPAAPVSSVLPIHSGNPFYRVKNQPNIPKTPVLTAEEARRAAAEAAETRRRVESIMFAPDLHSRLHYEESIDHWEHDAIPGQWTGA